MNSIQPVCKVFTQTDKDARSTSGFDMVSSQQGSVRCISVPATQSIHAKQWSLPMIALIADEKHSLLCCLTGHQNLL